MRGYHRDAVLLVAALVLVQGCGTGQPVTQPGHTQTGQSAQTRSGTVAHAVTQPCYVVLTDLAESDPYFEAVRQLQAYRSAQVVRFPTGNVAEAIGAIRQARPEFVAVVVRPETLDINFAYDMLEMSAKVDDDSFVDFAYGFITGTTATDAVELVKRTIAMEAGTPPARRCLFAFGPSSVPQADVGNAFAWLPTWQSVRVEHKPGQFPHTNLSDLAAADVIRFWGHGAPDSVDGSIACADLKTINVHAVVFAGPCLSAVVQRYYDSAKRHGKLKAMSVSADQSLALTFLSKGAPAYFGALQDDRCISAGQEMEYALTSGEPLGMTIKHSYDRIAMAQTNGMRLVRFRAGKPTPSHDGLDAQVRLAAAMVLLGDPAFRPFAATVGQPVETAALTTPTGVEIVATIVDPRVRSLFVDQFYSDLGVCGDTDNDTLYVRVRLPEGTGAIRSVRRVELPSSLERVEHSDVTWEEEQWQDERFLHLQIDFEPDTLQDATNATVRFVMDVAKTDTKLKN